MAETTTRPTKRVTINRWDFGFRVDEGHLVVDVAGGDPAEITFINRTDLDVVLEFPRPFLDDGSGRPLGSLPLSPDRGPGTTVPLLASADGWYQYRALVRVKLPGFPDGIEATGGTRPDVGITR